MVGFICAVFSLFRACISQPHVRAPSDPEPVSGVKGMRLGELLVCFSFIVLVLGSRRVTPVSSRHAASLVVIVKSFTPPLTVNYEY
jgi:hypothetical protein